MALLKTMMPGNAQYFLGKYLEWLRWYNRDFVLWLDSKMKSDTFDDYHAILRTCYYDHEFDKNMALIIGAIVLIILIWGLFTLIDLIRGKKRS